MIHTSSKEGVILWEMENGSANVLDLDFLKKMELELKSLTAESVSALIITGRGKTFSAGVDLFKILDGKDYVKEFLSTLTRVLLSLFQYPRPIVAAINGHAIAGGYFLASTCDFKIMANNSGKIGMPEVKVGVPFPTILLELARFSIPPNRLQEVVYFGSLYESEAAKELGFIDSICESDDLLPEAIKIAKQLGEIPSKSFEMTKSQLRKPMLEKFHSYSDTIDSLVTEDWASDETQRQIESYIKSATGKKSK